MKINYNKSLRVVMLGMTPYYRLGPEKWFDRFSIISYLSWEFSDTNSLKVSSIRDRNPNIILQPESTQSLVRTAEFRDIVEANGFDDAYFISYRPIEMAYGKSLETTAKRHSETFENKYWFRANYSNRLKMPRYKALKLSKLDDSTQETFRQLSDELGSNLVIQHDRLTGGRGTFFASDLASFERVVQQLKKHPNTEDGHYIIISEAIRSPKEISVQACVTKYGTFIGPSQSQIVRHPLLVNTKSPTADQFCGGMISQELTSKEQRETMVSMVKTIAVDLERDGYTGIFGVDFLLGESGEMYAIEVNARMTGMLPLLSQLQKDYPFLLLHILEKTGSEYTIGDVDLENPEETSDGAYVVLHDLAGEVRTVSNVFRSGQYANFDDRTSVELSIPDHGVLLHSYVTSGDTIAADKRVAAMFMGANVDISDPLGGIPASFIKDYHASIDT